MMKMSENRAQSWSTQHGFLLVELLIALAISSVLLATVINALINQRQVYTVREQVAEMQQNARIGLDVMIREITMAGYDPTDSENAGFFVANANSLRFKMDLDGDGNPDEADEHVTYALYDADGDGDQDLGRDLNLGGGPQLVAENIQSLAFMYTLADGSTIATPAVLNEIRAIDIAFTARTAQPDQKYDKNSGYRTQILTTTVQVRNMGL